MHWLKNSGKPKVLGTFQETSSATESMLKSKIIEITLEVSQKVDVVQIANDSSLALIAMCLQDGLDVASQK